MIKHMLVLLKKKKIKKDFQLETEWLSEMILPYYNTLQIPSGYLVNWT